MRQMSILWAGSFGPLLAWSFEKLLSLSRAVLSLSGMLMTTDERSMGGSGLRNGQSQNRHFRYNWRNEPMTMNE
jgi:hypothetical protein